VFAQMELMTTKNDGIEGKCAIVKRKLSICQASVDRVHALSVWYKWSSSHVPSISSWMIASRSVSSVAWTSLSMTSGSTAE